MVKIIQSGHPTLRAHASTVLIKDIGSPKIKKILSDMKKALAGEDDGVAIAAPQINISLRIFVVSGKVFNESFIRGGDNLEMTKSEDKVYINPKITKMSKDRKLLSEGCLSVRPMYGKVRRATRASIEAYDENGKKFTMDASGLLAHIFQHETDHLDGILFIDKAKDLHEATPEEEYKNGK
ncbi:MAG: peptide deformylase [Patescibacteria group bacterium]|jgi:peptide deformylase|nr:peptide deformylase [Patescibacteria group bacterium]